MFYTARACARTHTHRSPPYAATSGDTSDEHLNVSLVCADPTGPTETYPGDSVETSLVAALARGAGERGVRGRSSDAPAPTVHRTNGISLYTLHFTAQGPRGRPAARSQACAFRAPFRLPHGTGHTRGHRISRFPFFIRIPSMFPRALAAHIRFHGNTPPRIRALRDGAPPSDTHHTSDSPPTTRRRLYVTHTHTHITITQTQARYEDNTSHGCHPFRFRRRSTRIHAILDAPRSLPGPPKMLKRNTTSMTIYASRE
jgi:hypothetical protein